MGTVITTTITPKNDLFSFRKLIKLRDECNLLTHKSITFWQQWTCCCNPPALRFLLWNFPRTSWNSSKRGKQSLDNTKKRNKDHALLHPSQIRAQVLLGHSKLLLLKFGRQLSKRDPKLHNNRFIDQFAGKFISLWLISFLLFIQLYYCMRI